MVHCVKNGPSIAGLVRELPGVTGCPMATRTANFWRHRRCAVGLKNSVGRQQGVRSDEGARVEKQGTQSYHGRQRPACASSRDRTPLVIALVLTWGSSELRYGGVGGRATGDSVTPKCKQCVWQTLPVSWGLNYAASFRNTLSGLWGEPVTELRSCHPNFHSLPTGLALQQALGVEATKDSLGNK
jgi:hypothetical protein